MTELAAYEGDVEAILRANADELLRELMGVIEAALEKSIRLTKSGIPPKPLWAAVNDRLLWSDPKAILYDWDEVDQIRFAYSLAERLHLVQPDAERLLTVGPGADVFYLASPSRRALMLRQAYLEIVDWDERCDARNEQGHRYNFGQTFRRDFLRDPVAVRGTLFEALATAPSEKWCTVTELARDVSERDASLLISEDDEAPEILEGEADPEVLRLCQYWIVLAARFGWVDLGRTPPSEEGEVGERVFRLTELGERMRGGDVDDANEESNVLDASPFVVQPNHEVVFYRHEGDIADEYLLRRITSNTELTTWDEPTASYRISPESLRRALDAGLDLALLEERLVARSKTDIPGTFRALVDDARRRQGKVVLTQGLTAVELDSPTKALLKKLKQAKFSVFDNIAIVPWRRWPAFTEIIGHEVTEGFRYPPEEALASFTKRSLKLHWPALPMMARDFLDAAGVEGDPPAVKLDDAALGELAAVGWTAQAIVHATSPLTDGAVPKWLEKLAR